MDPPPSLSRKTTLRGACPACPARRAFRSRAGANGSSGGRSASRPRLFACGARAPRTPSLARRMGRRARRRGNTPRGDAHLPPSSINFLMKPSSLVENFSRGPARARAPGGCLGKTLSPRQAKLPANELVIQPDCAFHGCVHALHALHAHAVIPRKHVVQRQNAKIFSPVSFASRALVNPLCKHPPTAFCSPKAHAQVLLRMKTAEFSPCSGNIIFSTSNVRELSLREKKLNSSKQVHYDKF